jgi:hypothetical protein
MRRLDDTDTSPYGQTALGYTYTKLAAARLVDGRPLSASGKLCHNGHKRFFLKYMVALTQSDSVLSLCGALFAPVSHSRCVWARERFATARNLERVALERLVWQNGRMFDFFFCP